MTDPKPCTGVPCAYLDALVIDITKTVEPKEDEIRKVVQDYRNFQKISGPYLFLIYSSSSCLLIDIFYITGLQQVCHLHEMVSIKGGGNCVFFLF